MSTLGNWDLNRIANNFNWLWWETLMGSHRMWEGWNSVKNLRASPFNKDLSNDTTLSQIYLARLYPSGRLRFFGFLIFKSKTVVTKECLRNGLKYICLQNLESKLYFTKICLKIIFGNISHLLFWSRRAPSSCWAPSATWRRWGRRRTLRTWWGPTRRSGQFTVTV
jgi:hypothetical protein